MNSQTKKNGFSVNDLPTLQVFVTKKMIIMGATSSRDWQPIHHDSEWARDRAGLPDIIMNNYTQAGWISRYVTDWAGPGARLGRMKFSMRSPICPGDQVEFYGKLVNREKVGSFNWAEIDISIRVGERVVTTAWIKVALPDSYEELSLWHCPDDQWRP